jgi:hypothetical protein
MSDILTSAFWAKFKNWPFGLENAWNEITGKGSTLQTKLKTIKLIIRFAHNIIEFIIK